MKTISNPLPFPASSRKIADLPAARPAYTLSADGQHIAYVLTEGKQQFVVSDGVKGNPFDRILKIRTDWGSGKEGSFFSPFSNQAVYAALRGKKGILKVGTAEQDKNFSAFGPFFAWSPDGKQLAYQAIRCVEPSKCFFITVVGDREEGPYDELAPLPNYDTPYFYETVSPLLAFSPDGQKLAYVARKGTEWFIVINGKQQEAQAGVSYSGLLAAAAGINSSNPIANLQFSPDSQKLAYISGGFGKMALVLNGKKGKDYYNISGHGLFFSPDSQKIAYVAVQDIGRKQKWFVVVNDQEMPGYTYEIISPYDMNERLSPPKVVFSPDSKRFAYILYNEKGQSCVIVDGKELACYQTAYSPKFGKDGTLLYIAQDEKYGRVLWVNGKVVGKSTYDNIDKPIFSPDGKHLAYLAKEGGKWFVVLDGKEGEKFDDVLPGAFQFSPDGKQLGYNALKGNEVLWIVASVP